MNPRDRLMSAGKRWTDPAEALAQQVTERVVDLVVGALDVNELAARVDVNAILSRVDIDAVLRKIDLNSLLSQVNGVRFLLRRKGPEPPPLLPAQAGA